jgi:integrase
LIDQYLANQAHKAPTTVYTERVHLNNLKKWLAGRVAQPADRITHRDLEHFLQFRLQQRNPRTVHKERETIRQMFGWLVAQEYLDASPAVALTTIRCEVELPPFRTASEIETILRRGGLSEEEGFDLWNCLYLTPTEIGSLLKTVRDRADNDVTFLLHSIPAYTGMRRGEVIRLRWLDIEFDQGHIIARSLKQSRRAIESRRRIDLHPELLEELMRWRRRRPSGQFLVSEPGAEQLDPDTANRHFWQPLRGTSWCLQSRRNLFKVGFHTYRHSFASNLAARGVDQRIIDEFMGHQTQAMRKRYRHLFPSDRRNAISTFSLLPTTGVGPPPPPPTGHNGRRKPIA